MAETSSVTKLPFRSKSSSHHSKKFVSFIQFCNRIKKVVLEFSAHYYLFIYFSRYFQLLFLLSKNFFFLDLTSQTKRGRGQAKKKGSPCQLTGDLVFDFSDESLGKGGHILKYVFFFRTTQMSHIDILNGLFFLINVVALELLRRTHQ